MTLKQNLILFYLKHKLKRHFAPDRAKQTLGILSVIFAAAALISLFFGFSVFGLITALIASILGLIGLRNDYSDIKSIIGFVLGVTYFIIFFNPNRRESK